MIIIPAVDIKNGKCVRLLQGRQEDETVFSNDPAAMAQKWANAGAELIHVVDLDGAFEKRPQNLDAVKKILTTVNTPIQLGGGIRDERTAKTLLDLGVQRVIIGTEAIKNPEWVMQTAQRFPGQVVVGIDARDGWVAIEGWTQTTTIRAIDLARRFEGCGLAAINFTDIYRDGMQTGPNITATGRLAEAISIPVVASGGVSTIEDIKNLLPLESLGVTGVITGKALYSGTLDFQQALALVQSAQQVADKKIMGGPDSKRMA
ncbi:MAG: 1-(5-phosphoribosyl)-5-[(5-phosphoribosylamino)methylideneamino]imidazole-4-carboxamide isomerase [Deltaproteobacteria bacterium]|jgi:phosphoribosylformimino-5-aminoimidazole carboxamide ribotide isomerase|nr:1-(5-phosphoribosyl)-5-[(5-phosphoribosylamino)methylideneamino]imidazole-4-carboxamide isomerase [Deltaproteobacteria bacterium]MBW2480921.1 1-(5-phosphoribosyl)-5-[(5-phosphoribosylamino)methylideneamino]imidazole-4-carboxamide isomerase [Deltaproteobacteria bacterium]